METPGDPTDAGVKATTIIKALVAGDAWEATVLSVLRCHPGALAGSCGQIHSWLVLPGVLYACPNLLWDLRDLPKSNDQRSDVESYFPMSDVLLRKPQTFVETASFV